jgi:hypothetical protein
MGDCIETKLLLVLVQENGIIRLEHPGHPLHGHFLGRLDGKCYQDLPKFTSFGVQNAPSE